LIEPPKTSLINTSSTEQNELNIGANALHHTLLEARQRQLQQSKTLRSAKSMLAEMSTRALCAVTPKTPVQRDDSARCAALAVSEPSLEPDV